MDTEVLEMRIRELLEELGKLEFEDPKRKAINDEINNLSRILLDAEKRDQERINSNVQNDIQEERLRIDSEKIKADKADSKRRLLGDILKLTGSLLGSFGLALLSFKGEWLSGILKDRTLWEFAKNLKPRH